MEELSNASFIALTIDDSFELTSVSIAKTDAIPGDIASIAVELALKLIV